MKKEKEEQQKPLFEVWLEAYNNRLVEVAHGAKAPAPKVPAEDGSKSEPPSGASA